MDPRLDGCQLRNTAYRANLVCGHIGYEMLNTNGKYVSVVLEEGGVFSKPRIARPVVNGNVAVWKEVFPYTDVKIIFGVNNIQFFRILRNPQASNKYKWRIIQEHKYDIPVSFMAIDANQHMIDVSIKEERGSDILLPRNTNAKVRFIYDELAQYNEVVYPVVMC